MNQVTGHAGELAVAVARAHGVETMFTLSGAHVFPMYDGAVKAEPPMRILDVRHEQTAAFAAEATGKLTRVPGLAVLTAGPGVTNGISAIAQAQFAGSPMVVVGGRAPQNRWGSGSLQELDQPPIVASITKDARTIPTAAEVADGFDDAFRAAGSSHRGPVFVDIPMDEFFNTATSTLPAAATTRGADPDTDALDRIVRLIADAERPVLILGTDVWADGAEREALGAGRGDRPPRDHQRHGPRRDPGRPPAARHQGPRQGAQHRRPRRRGRHAPRLPPGVRRLRRQGGCRACPCRARGRLPRSGLRPRSAGGLRVRQPGRGAHRPRGRPRPGRPPVRGRPGSRTCRRP